MAKRSTALAHRPNIIVMSPPRRGGQARRVVRAVGRGVRRGARAGARTLPTTGVAIGALIVGYLQGKGFLEKLPQIGGSRVLTLGIAGYAVTRFVKNPSIRQAGLAALAAAAFDFGRVQGGGTSGFDDVNGDAGGGPHSGQGY